LLRPPFIPPPVVRPTQGGLDELARLCLLPDLRRPAVVLPMSQPDGDPRRRRDHDRHRPGQPPPPPPPPGPLPPAPAPPHPAGPTSSGARRHRPGGPGPACPPGSGRGRPPAPGRWHSVGRGSCAGT